MRDALEARGWAENVHALPEALAGFLTAASQAFRRLHAIQFDAPWQRARGR